MESNSHYTTPSLCDYGGDMNARWFISFDFTDPVTGIFKRKQLSRGMNYIHVKQDRYAYGKELEKHFLQKLKAGWNPITNKYDQKKEEEDPVHTIKLAVQYAAKVKKAATNRKKTKQGYDDALRLFEKWMEKKKSTEESPIDLSEQPPVEFTEFHAQQFMNHLLLDKKYKAKSHNNMLIYFRALFTALRKSGIVKNNPFSLVSRLRAEKGNNIAFTDNEVTVLDEHLQKHHFRLWLFKEFMYCGIRRTELTYVRVRDVLEDSILIMSSSAKNSTQEAVSITPRMRRALDYMELNKFSLDDFIFGRSLITGPLQFLNPSNISMAHLKISREAGIREECTLNSWRHTGAVKLYQATKDPYLVMRFMRHSDLKITMIYLRSLGIIVNDQLTKLEW